MSGYLRWNDAIAANFFKPEMAGRDVYLYVTPELVSELAAALGATHGDFIEAVKAGPPWATREGLCQRALQALDGWRLRGLEYPPYVAYLGLFVLAAGAEGDFAPHAYYPRLRQLLGYPLGSMLPSFEQMYKLWDDLERWSMHDKRGELGTFKARIIGGWFHVGLPIAQTILTERERTTLRQIFFESALDPTSSPSAEELARVLCVFSARLRPRTIKLLASRQDPALYQALLETVADELAAWDGVAPGDADDQSASPRHAIAALRLCLRVDLTAQKAEALLRCRLNRDFPEGTLLLSAPGLSLQAEEFIQGWSTPLTEIGTGALADASEFDWAVGLVLRDDSLGWQFRLPPRSVRVFVEGAPEGLPGLIEANALPRAQEFFLAYTAAAQRQLEPWTREGCRGFREHPVAGLPPGWRLASVDEALTDEGIRGSFPSLSFSTGQKLRLIGGLRSSRGNSYFSFVRPQIEYEGREPNLEVTCNGRVLSAVDGLNIFELPDDLPTETRIVVEAKVAGETVSRQSVYLTGDFDWRAASASQRFDRFGTLAAANEKIRTWIIGARVEGEVPDTSRYERAALGETLHNVLGGRRAFLIGRAPGEVARWPEERLPEKWHPVWVLTRVRRGAKVVFCGAHVSEAAPIPILNGDRRKVRAWKKLVWYARRRVAAPTTQPFRDLWKQYQEVAKHV